MKRAIIILLALVMVLSLAACGVEAKDETEQSAETPETDSESTTKYAIGESFGTDSVECVLTNIKWITPEELDLVLKRNGAIINGESVYELDTASLFPECASSFGKPRGVKSAISDSYYLCAVFSLKKHW